MFNRFYLILLVSWLGISFLCFPFFMYLANHPGVMLGIENTQPGVSRRLGKEYVSAGNLAQAVQAFSRAKKQFTELYEETGLERHKEYKANVTIELADAYRILGVTPERQIAVQYYQEVLQDFPDGKHGQWHGSIGMALEQLQRYDEAIVHFDKAASLGTGLTRLYVYYERGRSYLEKKEYDKACEDLYWFVRSQRWEMSEEQWLEFLHLENASNGKKHFILAFTHRFLNQTDQAIDQIQKYLEYYPNDRAALYLQSSLLDQPFKQDAETLPLSEILPPQDQSTYLLTSGMLNLYIADPGNYVLQLTLKPANNSSNNQPVTSTEMNGEETGFELPKLTVSCNGEEQASFYVAGDEPTSYSIGLELMEGKNIIQLETQDVLMNEPLQSVYVYSMELSKTVFSGE